ncbi:MAG: response regulator [Chloroflexi bacterium]|nr:response regulator [Chloroflexota bacterium]
MRLLVIDDDLAIREALSICLSSSWEDCEVLLAEDGDAGLRAFFGSRPDLIVLDLGLPGMSGYDVLQRIREVSDCPVLVLSARHGETDKVRALDMGADDYVTKPCGYLELLARIHAIRRRAQSSGAVGMHDYVADGLTVRFPRQEVEVNGRSVPLTNTECRLLYQLVSEAGSIVRHRDLLRRAWGSESYGPDVVRVYISRLRSKIEPDPTQPRYITTKPGVGYMFTVQPLDSGVEPDGHMPTDTPDQPEAAGRAASEMSERRAEREETRRVRRSVSRRRDSVRLDKASSRGPLPKRWHPLQIRPRGSAYRA